MFYWNTTQMYLDVRTLRCVACVKLLLQREAVASKQCAHSTWQIDSLWRKDLSTSQGAAVVCCIVTALLHGAYLLWPIRDSFHHRSWLRISSPRNKCALLGGKAPARDDTHKECAAGKSTLISVKTALMWQIPRGRQCLHSEVRFCREQGW